MDHIESHGGGSGGITSGSWFGTEDTTEIEGHGGMAYEGWWGHNKL